MTALLALFPRRPARIADRALVTVVAVLALLAFPATAGAISGEASDGSAGSAQYPLVGHTGSLGDKAVGGSNPGANNAAVRGVTSGGGGGGGGLPFTGFAIVSLAGFGVLSLSAGVAIRRRVAHRT